MNTRYDYMNEGVVADIDGEVYPDVLSVNFSDFKLTSIPKLHQVTSADICKFWVYTNKVYDAPELDDLLLTMNGIGYIGMLEPGSTLLEFSKSDIENFNTNKRPEVD